MSFSSAISNAPIFLVLPMRVNFYGPASQLEAAHFAKRHQFTGWQSASLEEARSLASNLSALQIQATRWNVLTTWPTELVERTNTAEIAVFPMRVPLKHF